jgi:serine/threonine-protein kinase
MALSAGARLGSYEVVALVGAGGMGEVYRARDTKLGRDVALKVLPDSLAHDPERLARFEREAHLLAALNHPHIAQIYGVEDSTGVPALVMELVEGPTLADRISRGPIPLDEALPVAKQIAEALEAAHEQGIIHRDLKPANIKVRADGTVKVLDFGLAKAFDPTTSPGAGATMSPTLSIHATQAGIILGTAAYMAPEQARGKPVDRRVDIWAFGCVLYETLTGRRAFGGDDISTTLAAVLKTEPEWSALPSGAPPSLRQLLTRCLRKDSNARLRDIGDARIAIDDLLSGAVDESTPSTSRRASWRRLFIPAAMLVAGGLVTGSVVWFAAHATVTRPRVSKLPISLPSTEQLSVNDTGRHVALTPDGSQIVYIGANGTTLFVRPVDRLEATPLAHGVGLRDPFVSPDGQWVGFFDGPLVMKRVPLTGGAPVLVARLDAPEQGATWAADGTIIFATGTTATGLQRVSADGGSPVVLTRPDHARGETTHRWPEQLPGGRTILYTVLASTGGLDAASIAAVDLRTGRLTIVLRGGTGAQFAPSGHLVYATTGTLRAVAFDPTRLTIVGQSTPVVTQVRITPVGAADAALARDGTLVYVVGGAEIGFTRTLVWVDRRGRETPIAAPQHLYATPRISPDGTRVAMMAVDGGLWVWDLGHATLTRVTIGGTADLTPVWTLDGRRLVFASDRRGAFNLFSQAADGTGAVERLTDSPNRQGPSAISPEGTRVVFTERFPTTGQDVMALSLDGTHHVLPLVQTPVEENNGIVSPDGRWLAYEANDSGAFEVYVRPFPAVNSGRWQVSTTGGTQPLWSHNGRELFYFAPNGALMRVSVVAGPAWTASAPTKVLEGPYVVSTAGNSFRNYDITADGQRFLLIKASAGNARNPPPQIVVIEHFDEELKRLVPTK